MIRHATAYHSTLCFVICYSIIHHRPPCCTKLYIKHSHTQPYYIRDNVIYSMFNLTVVYRALNCILSIPTKPCTTKLHCTTRTWHPTIQQHVANYGGVWQIDLHDKGVVQINLNLDQPTTLKNIKERKFRKTRSYFNLRFKLTKDENCEMVIFRLYCKIISRPSELT